MKKPQNDIGNLHPGVVDVVLHLDAPAGVPQQPLEGVAEHSIAQVPDVRGLVRIDAGVFDDRLRRAGTGRNRFSSGMLGRAFEKRCAVQVRVQISATGNFQSRNSFDRCDGIGNLLRQQPGGFFSFLASSKQTGVATSPISSRGGRSVSTVTSSL